MVRRSIVLSSLLLFAYTASPQTLERVLVPVNPGDVPGANGSIWRTDLIITNVSDMPLTVTGYLSSSFCGVLCAGAPPLPPKVSVIVDEMLRCDTRGGYLFVEQSRAADLAVSLRSRDLSRRLETWGTTVPAVRSADLFSGTFGINDVPMESQFRSTLRVYNVDPTGGVVTLRFYQTLTHPPRGWPTFPHGNPDRLLLELQPAFIVPTSGGGTASCPSFFEIALDQYPQLVGVARMRIEVAARDARRSYWAFVSTTHNTTQHVTVLTPE